MTKIESLKARLLAAELRHDMREAQRIFMEIQRETWRSVKMADDPSARITLESVEDVVCVVT